MSLRDAWKKEVLAAPMDRRVLISTVPFGDPDDAPLRALRDAGAVFAANPFGRRLKESELAELIPDFEILIAGTEPVTANVMAAAPHLKLIARVGAGLDSVDLTAARERGIRVTYTPEAPAPAVAEMTIGLMLSLLRHIPSADRKIREGAWIRFAGKRLADITVGVVGAGRIGSRVIRHLAGGFPGARILANDLRPNAELNALGVRWVEKDVLYRECDIISLHVPLTPSTQNMLSAREFAGMKPSAMIINTARGGLVNEADLAQALRSGRLAAAALDVFEKEPYSGELASVPQCLLTCHMGSMSADCRRRMELEAALEAVRFIRKEPPASLVPEEEYEMAKNSKSGRPES